MTLKEKNKRALFDIITSEDSYLDIRNIIQKVQVFLNCYCIFKITSKVLMVYFFVKIEYLIALSPNVVLINSQT